MELLWKRQARLLSGDFFFLVLMGSGHSDGAVQPDTHIPHSLA